MSERPPVFITATCQNCGNQFRKLRTSKKRTCLDCRR
jgi:protein-arginine kinase activator protein McsA